MCIQIYLFILFTIRKDSSLCPNPFKGFTLQSEGFEGLKGSHSGGYRGIGMSPSEMKAGPISYKIKLECVCVYDRSFTSEHSLDTRNSVVNKKQKSD